MGAVISETMVWGGTQGAGEKKQGGRLPSLLRLSSSSLLAWLDRLPFLFKMLCVASLPTCVQRPQLISSCVPSWPLVTLPPSFSIMV